MFGFGLPSQHHARCDATELHFGTMETCPKRVRYTAEDVLDVLEERNEFDSDRGGMSSGEESDIDRQLMDLDEPMRYAAMSEIFFACLGSDVILVDIFIYCV